MLTRERTSDDAFGGGGVALSLLGGFELRLQGRVIPALVPETQRLLAFLALRNCLVSRGVVAGTLWPEASEMHAYASLRSALGRLTVVAREALLVTGSDVGLAPAVIVDLRDARALAHRLLEVDAIPAIPDIPADAIQVLSADCLPDWYDDWAVIEFEKWRKLRLRALDALALKLADAGRFGYAIAAALAAVRIEPLRESATTALIRVHLTEGNRSEALRALRLYEALLADELGIKPSPALRGLLTGLPRA